MIVTERVLGNRYEDAVLAGHLAAAKSDGRLEIVTLHGDMAQRRRLRVVTDAGTEIGINLGEGRPLRDGDVILDEDEGRVVTVSVAKSEFVRFECDPSTSVASAFAAGVHLGHLLGMQHWEVSRDGDGCAVEVADRGYVEGVLACHPIEGVSYRFSGDSWSN